MYINFNYLKKKELDTNDLMSLQIVKQLRTEAEREEDLAMILTDDFLDKMVERGCITQIKGKKSDSEIAKLRLTKSGNKLLEDIQTAEVEEQDILIFDWVAKFYKNEEDKMIGNMKRTKQGIAQFRKETGIEKNHLAFLFQSFLESEEQLKYSHKLENLLFSSKNLYSRKFNLDECRLYDFYLSREKYFNDKFKTIKN